MTTTDACGVSANLARTTRVSCQRWRWWSTTIKAVGWWPRRIVSKPLRSNGFVTLLRIGYGFVGIQLQSRRSDDFTPRLHGARKARCVLAEMRWRWTLKVLWAAACTERNLCADPTLLKPCILRSRRRVG